MIKIMEKEPLEKKDNIFSEEKNLDLRIAIYKYADSKNKLYLALNFFILLYRTILHWKSLNNKWKFIKNVFSNKKTLKKQSYESLLLRIFLLKTGYEKDRIVSLLAKDINQCEKENKSEILVGLESVEKKVKSNIDNPIQNLFNLD